MKGTPIPDETEVAGAALPPALYLVGTPIGNLEDITLRALRVLGTVDLVLAEDTRHSRILFKRHDLHTPMLSCHKFNERARVDLLVERVLGRNEAVALITDSGMPAISDPGARLVSACRAAGVPAVVIPGPSSLTAAAALSGLIEGPFLFEGFLPRKSGQRRRRLEELRNAGMPVMLFESPYRLLRLVEEIGDVMGEIPLYLGRELTKHFEESIAGTPAELLAQFSQRTVKGECVLVLNPPAPERREKKTRHMATKHAADHSLEGKGQIPCTD